MNTFFSISLFLLLLSNLVSSQEIRYLDKKGKITDATKASSLETVIDLPGGKYRIIKQKMNLDTISFCTYSSLNPLIRSGITKTFYNSGTLKYFINYREDKLDGPFIEYHENGKIKCILNLSNDIILFSNSFDKNGKEFDKNGKEVNYMPAFKSPKFKNHSLETFRNYLVNNVSYTKEAVDNKISEKCTVSFIFDRDGNLKDIFVFANTNSFRNEIIRVIQQTKGNWTPCELFGEKYGLRFVMSVNFIFR